MAERADGQGGPVQRVEEKVDRLSESVDRRFEQVDRRFEQVDRRFDEVDRRFDEVTEALVEQRQYTEFAFSRLEARMDAGFARVEGELRRVDGGMHAGLTRIEHTLERFIGTQISTNELVDRRLRRLEERSP